MIRLHYEHLPILDPCNGAKDLKSYGRGIEGEGENEGEN
jgi:hypothetical protein